MSSTPRIIGAWQKATRSNDTGTCVELAPTEGGGVALRDSKNPAGPVQHFTGQEMASFLDGAKKGEFDHLVEGL